MNNIKITLQEVSDYATQIRNLNNKIYDDLSLLKEQMNGLSASWLSNAGETIRGRFIQFSSRFEQQKEIIDSYARFLDMTVSSYESLENTLNSNAGSINA